MNTRAFATASIFLLTTSLGAFSSAARADTVDISAVPSKFTPDKIVMHVGEKTTLHFAHIEGVHAIASDALGIKSTVLSAGKAVDVDVTPTKAGTYVLHCEIVCGADHDNMMILVTVES